MTKETETEFSAKRGNRDAAPGPAVSPSWTAFQMFPTPKGPGAAPSHLQPLIDGLTDDAFNKVRDNLESDYFTIAERLGIADEFAATDENLSDDRRFLVALLELPTDELHGLAKANPAEFFGYLCHAVSLLPPDNPGIADAARTFLGPEIIEAVEWKCAHEFTATLRATTIN